MMTLFVSLMIASLVGTIFWFVLYSIRPMTQKLFSQTWHYYSTLIPVFFLLGGVELVNRLISVIRSFLPESSSSPNVALAATDFSTAYAGVTEQTFLNSASFMNPLNNIFMHMVTFRGVIFVLLIIWMIGVAVFLGVHVTQYLRFKRLILQNSRVWKAEDGTMVRVSPDATTPMVMGFRKPVIVLPDMDYEENQLAMILSHERIHLQRRDILVKVIVLITNAVHWFNPVAYFITRQTHMYCELSCDEQVVKEMDVESRKFYGVTLLSMLEYGVMRRRVIGTSSLCHSKKDMKRRLNHLMKIKKSKKSIVVLSIGLASLLLGSGGGVAHVIGSAESNIPVALPNIEAEKPVSVVSIPPMDPNVKAEHSASYLADDIFGSSAIIEQHGGTREDYQEIERMLQVAEGKLAEDEFKVYMELSKQLMQLKLKITDENGVRHEEKLTKEEQQQFEKLASRLAPIFEKINGTAKP